MTSVTTRRERLREELLDEIAVVARQQLESGGPSGVTWRGIAREVGMSPAALYTYYESLDALYTKLIADSFDSLAGAVGRAIELADGRSTVDRLLAGIAGYREWALRHPGQYRLIYQNELPGYEAPDDGVTLAANLRGSAQLVALLVVGWRSGEFPPPPGGPGVDPTDMNARFGTDLTPDEVRVAMTAWATFHGVVQLEVNDHINAEWADTDQVFAAVVGELCHRATGSLPSGDVLSLVRQGFDLQGPPRLKSA